MIATFLILSQMTQVRPAGPVDMEPVPGVNWTCSLETEETSFSLNGRTPDFAKRREPFGHLPIKVESNGPEWTKGQHEIVALASAASFRRYHVTWDAKDGGSYSLDIVLLRDELGISALTYRPSPFGKVRNLFSKKLGSGVCESEFPAAVEGIVTQ